MPPCPLGSPAMAALLLVGLLMIPRAGECAGVSHRVSVFVYDAGTLGRIAKRHLTWSLLLYPFA